MRQYAHAIISLLERDPQLTFSTDKLRGAGIPVTCFREARFSKDQDTAKALTMHSCKGLEFPLVAIASVGRGEAQVKANPK